MDSQIRSRATPADVSELHQNYKKGGRVEELEVPVRWGSQGRETEKASRPAKMMSSIRKSDVAKIIGNLYENQHLWLPQPAQNRTNIA